MTSNSSDSLHLPKTSDEWLDVSWHVVEKFYKQLHSEQLSETNVNSWLERWSSLFDLLSECSTRLRVACDLDTTDNIALNKLLRFETEINSLSLPEEQRLKMKLLDSNLVLGRDEFILPLRRFRTEARLFTEENVPLKLKERELTLEYSRVTSRQTVTRNGEKVTIPQLERDFSLTDRNQREKSWRLRAERQFADKPEIDSIWGNLLDVRKQIAVNANCGGLRDYKWLSRMRFDYSPEDSKNFCKAIGAVIVPATTELYRKKASDLGVKKLKPWDLVDGWYMNPSSATHDRLNRDTPAIPALVEGAGKILESLDSELAEQFRMMRESRLLELESSWGKKSGAYCSGLPVQKRPFIFMHSKNTIDDVVTLFHECGHAFHEFAVGGLRHFAQRSAPMEFSEVASMAMEHIALTRIEKRFGGFFTPEDAESFRQSHLENCLLFWPFMAVVDSFQHWVYEFPVEAHNGTQCDEVWGQLWQRFIPEIDWSGLEQYRNSGWQRKQHIITMPFYYVEYGLAQVGALQILKNFMNDTSSTLTHYKSAISKGGLLSVPELYREAGAEFRFDEEILSNLAQFIVQQST